MSQDFTHQQWEPVVLKKTSESKPKPIGKTNSMPESESFDVDIKPIKYFTPSMGQKIQSLRSQKSWTQDELAKKLNMPKNTIQSLEQGKEKYSGEMVSKLKKILGNFEW
jgi:ribosome-binding protein aMBF1 (putative translation factor)